VPVLTIIKKVTVIVTHTIMLNVVLNTINSLSQYLNTRSQVETTLDPVPKQDPRQK
jgi:hypothetical protein